MVWALMSSTDFYSQTFPISWDQLQRDCRILSGKLMDLAKWKGIIAITRGGLVPVAIIARELEIRLVETFCVSSYDWQDQGEIKILKGLDGDGAGWLLMDDLVDTGRTAKVVRNALPKAYFATVYVKPEGKRYVDSFVTEVSQDTWILFPWDTQTQFVQPLIEQKESTA